MLFRRVKKTWSQKLSDRSNHLYNYQYILSLFLGSSPWDHQRTKRLEASSHHVRKVCIEFTSRV